MAFEEMIGNQKTGPLKRMAPYILCLFTFCYLFPVPVSGQYQLQWINHNCCFDSIAPHTFSFPFSFDLIGDTIVECYYNDGNLNLKKVDRNTGTDIQFYNHVIDTIESPFNFGGGSVLLPGRILTAAVKYRFATGQSSLWLSSFFRDFNQEWGMEIPDRNFISAPVTDSSASNFYIGATGDSIYLMKFDLSGNPAWETGIAPGTSNLNKKPGLILTGTGEPVLLVASSDTSGSGSRLRILKFDGNTGQLTGDSLCSIVPGNNFIYCVNSDTLRIACVNINTHLIHLIKVSLDNLQTFREFDTSLQGFISLNQVLYDPVAANLYLKTGNALACFSANDSLLFNQALPISSYDLYEIHPVALHAGGELTVSFTFENNGNTPPNGDLILYSLDKMTGTVLDSVIYNDVRNTSEIFIDQLKDSLSTYLVFANDFDNDAILHEETQLGIIKYNRLVNPVQEMADAHSGVRIYPQPASTSLHIICQGETGGRTAVLTDANGKIVCKAQFTGPDADLNVQHVVPGLYVLSVSGSDGVIHQKVIVAGR